jgi:hypothetical protein
MADGDSILRKRPRGGWATMSNEVLQDRNLSFRARGLAAYLLSMPDDWAIHLRQLATAGTEGREAVRAGLQELAAAGYMIRLRERGKGGRLRTVTMIADYPAWAETGTAQERMAGYMAAEPAELTGVPENRTPVEPHSGFLVGHTNDLDTNDVLGGEGVGGVAVGALAVSEPEPAQPALSQPAPVEPEPPAASWAPACNLTDVQRQAADLFRTAGIRSANQLAAARIVNADDVVWAGRMVQEYLDEGIRRPEWLHGRIMRQEQPTAEAERERRYGFAVPFRADGPADDDPVDAGGSAAQPDSEVVADPEPGPGLDAEAAAAWSQALTELGQQLPPATFDTWLRSSKLMALDGDEAVIGLPNRYAVDWLENRLRGRLQRLLGGLLHRRLTVRFVVAQGVGI